MTRFKIEPGRLDSLMDVFGRKQPIWEPGELGDVLKHQMAAPLLVDEAAGAGSDPSHPADAPTLASLINSPNPPISLLEKVMRVAAVRERRPGHLVPQEISSVLRFACIATARVRCGQLIGDLDEEVLRTRLLDLLKIPWLVPEVRDLFERAVQITAPSSQSSSGNPSSGSRQPGSRSTAPQESTPALDPAEIPQIGGYEILGRIGRGGTSTVWRARHLETNRDVALKLINASAMGEQARRRFEREVEIAARMEHRHIARLYDSGIYGGYLFAAMELVHGLSLDRYVKQQKLDRRQILELMATICDAVQYTHQRGVIHRDLKPANILVSADGQPHVLDFGLAKSQLFEQQMETYSLDGMVAGTLGFMSPQQAAGQSELVDTRSDVYSLGAILFCLLTGRTPHDLSGSHIQAVRRAAEEEVMRPRTADPTLDGDLEAVLLKALSRDPAARYASAGALADDLRHYLRDEPLSVRPPTLTYFLGKRLRRYRVPLSIAAAVVLCLIGTAVYAFIRISAASNIAQANEQRANEKAREAERQAQIADEHATAAALAQKKIEAQMITNLTLAGDGLALSQDYPSSRTFYRKAWDAGDPAAPPLPVATGLMFSYVEGPPPLLGLDGDHRMAGGFSGHEGRVNAVAVSPDGKLIATGGDDSTIRFWDSVFGEEISRIKCPEGHVNAIAFSPNGQTLVSGGDDGQINLWNVKTGKQLMNYSGHEGYINTVAFHPDGRRIFTGGKDQIIRIHDIEERPSIKEIALPAIITSIAISPDGKWAMSSSDDKQLRVWNLETYQVHRTLTSESSFRALAVAFSQDGHAAAGDDRGTVHHWNLATGNELKTFASSTPSPVFSVAYAPDGATLIAGSSDRNVRIWELRKTGMQPYSGHDGPIRAVAFLPDGKRFVSVGDDGAPRLWHTTRTADQVWLGQNNSGGISDIAVSTDGYTAWTGGGSNPLRQWDIHGAVLLRDLGDPSRQVTCIAKTPDDRFLLSGHGTGKLSLWDARTGQLLAQVETNPESAAQAPVVVDDESQNTVNRKKVTCVAIADEGDLALSSGMDGIVRVWELPTMKELRQYREHSEEVFGVALSHDRQTAVSVGKDQIVRTWDMRTGQVLLRLKGHNRSINAVRLSHDGRLMATACNDTTVRLWDAQRGTPLKLLTGHVSPVKAIAFSPDDKLLASAAESTLALWDVATGEKLRTFNSHSLPLRGLQFTPDGKSIISADHGGTVRKWDLTRPLAYRRFEERLAQARETLAKKPEDAAALQTFGEWYFFRGDYKAAATLLRRARSNGGSPSALMLARALRKSSNSTASIEEFEKAIAAREAPETYLKMCIDNARWAAGQAKKAATSSK